MSTEQWFEKLKEVSDRCTWKGYMISNGEVQQAIVAITSILEDVLQSLSEKVNEE